MSQGKIVQKYRRLLLPEELRRLADLVQSVEPEQTLGLRGHHQVDAAAPPEVDRQALLVVHGGLRLERAPVDHLRETQATLRSCIELTEVTSLSEASLCRRSLVMCCDMWMVRVFRFSQTNLPMRHERRT